MEKERKKILKLKSFESIEERQGGKIDVEVSKFNISDFNLLMGDNAQGKSRLLRTLFFFRSLASNVPQLIQTYLQSIFTFEINNNGSSDKVIYEISIDARTNKKVFSEKITLNDETIFSKKDKILLNEKENVKMENFFIPENISALSSITGNEFITIKLLREFFQHIVLVSSNKSRMIVLNPNAIIPNEEGSDISYVLFNWKEKFPILFKEIVADFLECYPFIKDVYLKKIALVPTGQLFDSLVIKENNIEFDIEQMNWSEGIYRLLWLLLLPKIPFQTDEGILPPSLILIDEIENGLDFKTLKYIVRYFQEYSDDSQIIMSSHSPLVCDFVSPDKWIIVKRKGTKLSFISPKEVESNLDDQLDLFKQKHWDFYMKHISSSDLYRVK